MWVVKCSFVNEVISNNKDLLVEHVSKRSQQGGLARILAIIKIHPREASSAVHCTISLAAPVLTFHLPHSEKKLLVYGI